MKKACKKYGYKEITFNNSKIRKLYHLYLHQTAFDKILDVLVLFAISFTVFEVVAELFFHLNSHLEHFIHSFSLIVLAVFALELFREYAHSQTRRDFFKKHWLDFGLVVFLSLYFISATYFGIARFRSLTKFGKYVGKAKRYKIVLKTIGSVVK
jgi:hypothetical protein